MARSLWRFLSLVALATRCCGAPLETTKTSYPYCVHSDDSSNLVCHNLESDLGASAGQVCIESVLDGKRNEAFLRVTTSIEKNKDHLVLTNNTTVLLLSKNGNPLLMEPQSLRLEGKQVFEYHHHNQNSSSWQCPSCEAHQIQVVAKVQMRRENYSQESTAVETMQTINGQSRFHVTISCEHCPGAPAPSVGDSYYLRTYHQTSVQGERHHRRRRRRL